MTGKTIPISRIVRRDEVPDQGIEVEIRADADTCKALADFADIPDVESFSARLTVAPWRRRGLSVRGEVEADVVQTCVVTLEPVRNHLREDVDVDYLPQDQRAPAPEEVVDPEAEDIEPLVAERIDVGALAVEHLVLGLDPYPRRSGVVFEAETDADSEAEKPFAKLAALRDRQGGS